MNRVALVLSIASLAVGVIYYVGSVAGLLWSAPTPPLDHGLVPTAAVFVLFGLVGLLVARGQPAEQA